jgi:hypothetical protein
MEFNFPANYNINGKRHLCSMFCKTGNSAVDMFKDAYRNSKEEAIANGHVLGEKVLITQSDSQTGLKQAINDSPRGVFREPFCDLLQKIVDTLSEEEKQKLASNPQEAILELSQTHLEEFKEVAKQNNFELEKFAIVSLETGTSTDAPANTAADTPTNTTNPSQQPVATNTTKAKNPLAEKAAGVALFILIIIIAAFYLLKK